MVKLLILHELIKGNTSYGNELVDTISKNINGDWKPSYGMIYPLLVKMEEESLIDGWWDIPNKKSKKFYKITDEGIAHYKSIKAQYKPKFEESLSILKAVLNTVYK